MRISSRGQRRLQEQSLVTKWQSRWRHHWLKACSTGNEEEVERVVLAMNEEATARDGVKNPEMPVPEARSKLERVQESVHDWKRSFEKTIGAELEKESVIRAMADEVDGMGKMNVWRRIQENSDEIPGRTKFVPTKWILGNKGDNDKSDIRARLVACEVK